MSGGGFLYFYATHTATASGSRIRRERCTGCSTAFEYRITRQVEGGGHSPFFLNSAGAAASAKERAYANLYRALDEVEPVHCPACGIFQPDMVQVLRQRYGKWYEPNKYASERIAVPAATAFFLAREADSVEAYTKFIEVWPDTHSQYLRSDEPLLLLRRYAEDRIKELKYPPYLRKIISGLPWIVYAAAGLFIASFYFMYALR